MIEEMPDEYINMEFIVANRAEVKNIFLTEYNEEKVLEKEVVDRLSELLPARSIDITERLTASALQNSQTGFRKV